MDDPPIINPDLESLHFTFFDTHFLLPCRLRFRYRLDTSLELVNLLPARLQLLLQVVQLLTVPALRLLRPFVKVKLDLTESLEARDEVVVEDAEVGERFGLCLPVLLLCIMP